MNNETTVNGGITYAEEELVFFEDGLFGFEEYRKFLPVSLEENSDAALCLQSVEDESLSFIVMNPFILCGVYEPVVSKEDLDKLGVEKEENLSYYVICVIRDTAEESTVNLKCPIVVNTVTREARQVILESDKYGFRHPLKEFAKER